MHVTENNRPALLAVVTLFSGFLQTSASPGSGFVGLTRDCELQTIDLLGRRTRHVRINLFPYDIDVSDAAESVWRDRPYSNGHQIDQLHLVAGYSYGGQTAVNYCRELKLRGGTRVVELALCDPVRRWSMLPGVAAALGLGSFDIDEFNEFHAEPFVRKCWWFRQQNPRYKFNRPGGWFQPAAHPVIGKRVEKPITRTSGHCFIDNDKEFRLRFLSSVLEMANHVNEVTRL